MNTFNRFLVILIALTAICFSLASLLAVWVIPDDVGVSLRQTATILRSQPLVIQGLVTAFSVSFILVALLILVGEFGPQEPSAIPLAGVAGGGATVSIETITERIKDEVEQVPGVRMARPRVRTRRGAIDATVELRTFPDVHLPTKADEVVQTVRRAVEEGLGVPVKDVRVNFQPDAGRGSARPQGEIRVPGAAEPPTARPDL